MTRKISLTSEPKKNNNKTRKMIGQTTGINYI